MIINTIPTIASVVHFFKAQFSKSPLPCTSCYEETFSKKGLSSISSRPQFPYFGGKFSKPDFFCPFPYSFAFFCMRPGDLFKGLFIINSCCHCEERSSPTRGLLHLLAADRVLVPRNYKKRGVSFSGFMFRAIVGSYLRYSSISSIF